MTPRQGVRIFNSAQPFRPFLIKLTDGQSFQIDHPESVVCSPDDTELAFYAADDDLPVAELRVVDTREVSEFAWVEQPAPPTGE